MKKIIKILKILFFAFLLLEYVPIKLAVNESDGVKKYNDKYSKIYKDIYVCTIEDASMSGYFGATKDNNPQLNDNIYFDILGDYPICILNKNLSDQCLDGDEFIVNNKYITCGNIKQYKDRGNTYQIYNWDIVYPVNRHSYLDIISPKYGLNVFDFNWIEIGKRIILKEEMPLKFNPSVIIFIFSIFVFSFFAKKRKQ